MKALIQRVTRAHVTVDHDIVGKIGLGIVVLLGIEQGDTQQHAQRLSERIAGYRIFNDNEGKMNLNIQQVAGSLLVISQFTLVADTQKGMRPSFSCGAEPERAQKLYHYFITQCRQRGLHTETGEFAADMQVELVNNGPVTFLLTV